MTRRIEYASEIWNHFVALTRRHYRLYGTYPGYYKLKRHLTKLKKQRRFQHWNLVGSQAAQMVIKRLDLSYQAHFQVRALPPGKRRHQNRNDQARPPRRSLALSLSKKKIPPLMPAAIQVHTRK